MPTTTITKGDTLLPLNSVIYASAGNPMDLSDYTVKVLMVNKDSGAVVVNELETGVTVHPTQNFTANATTDLLSCNAHGMVADLPIVLSTSGTLPGGLTAGVWYYPVQITPTKFAVSETPNGAPIDITSTGSGTHSFCVVGSVQYDWQSGDVDETGNFYLHFRIYDDNERVTAPHDGDTWLIQIVAPLGG